MMTLQVFLIISAALFCCGLYTVMTRQNGVAVLMGVFASMIRVPNAQTQSRAPARADNGAPGS